MICMSLISLSAVAVIITTSFYENDEQKCCYYQFFAKKASSSSLFIFHRKQKRKLIRHFWWKAKNSSLYSRKIMKKINICRCKLSINLISKCFESHFDQFWNDKIWSHFSFFIFYLKLDISWLFHIHRRLNAHFHYQFIFILIICVFVITLFWSNNFCDLFKHVIDNNNFFFICCFCFFIFVVFVLKNSWLSFLSYSLIADLWLREFQKQSMMTNRLLIQFILSLNMNFWNDFKISKMPKKINYE